jgi:hypothetical protein
MLWGPRCERMVTWIPCQNMAFQSPSRTATPPLYPPKPDVSLKPAPLNSFVTVEEPVPATPLVLVTGSDSIRVGFGSNFTYRRRLPNVVGTLKVLPQVGNQSAPAVRSELPVLGDAVDEKLAQLDLTYPVQNGIVTDWVRLPAERFSAHFLCFSRCVVRPLAARDRTRWRRCGGTCFMAL